MKRHPIRRRLFEPIVTKEPQPTSVADAGACNNTIAGQSNNIMTDEFISATGTSKPQRDWHVEILSGLFLRCEEQELDWLESEVDRNINIHQESVDAGGDTPVTDGTESHKQFNSFEELQSDFSVLSLIPSSLRGICGTNKRKRTAEITIEDSSCMDFDGKKCIGHPLIIPSSWKRRNYESLTRQELEQKVIKSVEQDGVVDRSQTGCLYSSETALTIPNYTTEQQDEGESYNMMTILYNESSLSALANWAMMDPPNPELTNPSASEVTPIQSPMRNEEWEKYARETSDRMARDSSTYNMPVTPPTFRMCGVCGKFGHYEVECELLQDSASLDENVRKSIVSKLATEIRVQRLWQGLMDDVQHETSKRQKLGQIEYFEDVTRVDVNDEEENYVAKSTNCSICKSGLAGNRSKS